MKLREGMRAWSVFPALAAALLLLFASPRRALAGPNDRVVVSLGDSYSSGEGCPPFYGQDSSDKYSEEDWLAHRSMQSWEGQLVLGDGTRLRDVKASQPKDGERISSSNRWYFYASSGAVAVNVYSRETDPDTGKPYYQTKEVEKGIVESGTPYHIAPFEWDEYSKVPHDLEIQIDAALADLKGDGLSGSDVDYVTISIGGNDVGFVPIVTEVALRSGFVDRDYLYNAMNTAWYKFDRRVAYRNTRENLIPSTVDASTGGRTKREEIRQCYLRIAEEFPDAHIIVAGYPTLLDDDAFERTLAQSEKTGLWNRFLTWAGFYDDNVHSVVGFASWESWFVNQNVKLFNSELSRLVAETNTELIERAGSADASRLHFVSVEGAFDGHEAYTKKPYLNEVMVTQGEDLSFIPPVSSYSMHPNYLGETKAGKVADGISAYREAVQSELTRLEAAKPLVAILDDDKNPENAAIGFIEAWYDDWTFADGHDIPNEESLEQRCLPLIEENTALYDEFVESFTGLTGKYSRDVATCVVSTPSAEKLSDGVFRVTVRYLAAQNSVSQSWYNRLLSNPSEDVWDVTVNKNLKITGVESATSSGNSFDDSQITDNNEQTLIVVEDYYDQIEQQANNSVVYSTVGDFDGDGREEAFLLTGEPYLEENPDYGRWVNVDLWFVPSGGSPQHVSDFKPIVYMNGVIDDPESQYKLLSIETTAGGSGSTSHVYGVRNGSPIMVSVTGCAVQEHDGKIIEAKSTFQQGGGHMHEWYELTFNPDTFTLVEGSYLGLTDLYDSSAL